MFDIYEYKYKVYEKIVAIYFLSKNSNKTLVNSKGDIQSVTELRLVKLELRIFKELGIEQVQAEPYKKLDDKIELKLARNKKIESSQARAEFQ